jgi:hypothetical protein
MTCRSCQSENQKTFESEIDIHCSGKDLQRLPVLVFPRLTICLDCGFVETVIAVDELKDLIETR